MFELKNNFALMRKKLCYWIYLKKISIEIHMGMNEEKLGKYKSNRKLAVSSVISIHLF